MNWDLKTATGREKMLIRERKLFVMYQMEPDLIFDKPHRLFPYLAEDCVLRSEKLPKPLTGRAIRDFLIREKRACEGFGPMPGVKIVEAEEDGDILLRIRPRIQDPEPDGELVRVELNGEGKIREISRFAEQKVLYREFSTSISLVPARRIREGETIRIEKNDAERVSFSSLDYDAMTLIFDILPVCPLFEEMEERYMNRSDWVAILRCWNQINETEDEEAIREWAFRIEEKSILQNRDYGEELEDLISSVVQNRDPFGRRMQRWMEDWLNGCGDEYDMIWKC